MKSVGVDCQFRLDGRVIVYRVHLENRSVPVEQGRQWVDHEGRHVLIMFPGQPVQELLLRKDTLTWGLRPQGHKTVMA